MKGKKLPDFNPGNLNFPPDEVKIVRSEGVYKIFDRLRKKYYILTPEEYVRQRFVDWMIIHLGYPPSLMANEIGINLNNTIKRCDTVVFSNNGTPLVIVEYKAPYVEISQEVFNQIYRYNMALKAKVLIVSNGITHYCCRLTEDYKNYEFLMHIPSYSELLTII